MTKLRSHITSLINSSRPHHADARRRCPIINRQPTHSPRTKRSHHRNGYPNTLRIIIRNTSLITMTIRSTPNINLTRILPVRRHIKRRLLNYTRVLISRHIMLLATRPNIFLTRMPQIHRRANTINPRVRRSEGHTFQVRPNHYSMSTSLTGHGISTTSPPIPSTRSHLKINNRSRIRII